MTKECWFLLLVFLLFLSVTAVYSDEIPTDDIYSAFSAYREAFSSLFPREEGSGEEKTLRELIKEELYELGIPYADMPIDNIEGFHTFSRDILATVDTRSPVTVCLVVPVNTYNGMKTVEYHYASIAFALILLDRISRNPPMSYNLEVLFSGAEYSSHAFAGTFSYIKSLRDRQKRVVLYLSIENIRQKPRIYHTGGIRKSPAWLVMSVLRSAEARNIDMGFSSSSIYQMLSMIYKDATPFSSLLSNLYTQGIPAIAIANDKSSPIIKDERQAVTDIMAMLEDSIKRIPTDYSTTWENHYLVVKLPYMQYLVIREYYYTLFIFLSIVLISAIAFTRYRSIKRYFKALTSSYGTPLVFVILTIFLMLATLLDRSILEFKGYDRLIELRLIDFVFLKLSVSIFLFSLFIWIIHIIPIRLAKNTHFYTANALLFLAIDMAIFGSILLPLALFFLWAIVCTLLFSSSRNIFLRVLFSLLAPLWFIRAFAIMLTEARQLARLIVIPTLSGDLFLAFLLLPFFLLLMRLDIYIHNKRRRKGRLLVVVISISLVAIVAFSTRLLLTPIFANNIKQPVDVYTISSDNTNTASLNIESPAYLPDMTIKYANIYRGLSSARIKKLSFLIPPPREEVISYDYSIKTFLGRKIIRLYINSKRPIKKIKIEVTGSGDIPILDCNFPYISTDKNTAIINIGKNPPLPLEIILGIKESDRARMVIHTTTDETAIPVEIDAENIEINRYGKYIKTLDL
ncbi:hypothetical protein WKV44_05785 [Spirochaetia bacterium 38H-sp]|uniref:Peptidase M28 domain-containing protein n=1 Tax=Rarispira pelagica TaxID=3141764 RepID=A0ABU9UD25_9SPIR